MYTLGIPAWGVLVGLELDGKPVLGVAAIPPMDEIAFARRGGGCHWLRGTHHCSMPAIQVRAAAKRVRISDSQSLKEAFGITCTLKSWEKAGFGDGHERIRRTMKRCQNGGFNCYNYVMLVSGRVGLAFDPVMKPWDLAALAPLVSEAGGVYSDLGGNETIHGGSFMAGAPKLHREAMALFRSGS
jgi:histidinol-phosphatase